MLYLVLIASLYIFKASAQSEYCEDYCSSCSTVVCGSTSAAQIGCNFNVDVCIWCNENCEGTESCIVDQTTGSCGETEGWSASNCCSTGVTPEPTPQPTYECPTTLSSSADCSTIYDEECCINYDECKVVESGLCNSEDASPDACCTAVTPSPTTPAPVTDEPTLSPTCPTNLGTCEDYADYGYDCCPDTCTKDTSKLCVVEGGEGCCTTTTPEPTTPEPTTPEPTTPEPTTPEPTTPEPTTPEPTTPEPTTPEPTTPEPTTPSPTTPEPTTSTTESSESEEESSTTESGESEEDTPSPTSYNRWPTKRPTLPSAEKWEMIHPAYKGSDGELLWQVYYGDFSNDDRFDSFRSAEKWDTKEITPIIMKDAQFMQYRNANSKKFNQQSAVVTDNNSGAQSYGTWLIVISAVLILLFAAWYKYGSYNKNKQEYTPLLSEEKIQYDQ